MFLTLHFNSFQIFVEKYLYLELSQHFHHNHQILSNWRHHSNLLNSIVYISNEWCALKVTESSCFSYRKSKWNLTKSNTVPLNSAVQDSVSHKVQTEGQTKLFLAGKEDQSGNRGSSCSRKTTCRSQCPKNWWSNAFTSERITQVIALIK